MSSRSLMTVRYDIIIYQRSQKDERAEKRVRSVLDIVLGQLSRIIQAKKMGGVVSVVCRRLIQLYKRRWMRVRTKRERERDDDAFVNDIMTYRDRVTYHRDSVQSIGLCVYSFICSFIHSFIRSFVHSIILLSTRRKTLDGNFLMGTVQSEPR